MPEFIVKLGDKIIQNRRFEGDLLRIGRSRENDIVLENLSVSRDHAQIRLHDGQFILTDLNSANGTLVNGVRITKTEIVDEDVITIGKHKLHFHNRVIDDLPAGTQDNLRTVMVEPRAEARLVVESGKLKGREFKLTRFETSLGKAPGNDVVLTDDWLLGKKQAIILRKGNNAFEIEDLGGLRKVKVNGVAIAEKTSLKDGDHIELGGTKLLFSTSAGPSLPTGRVPSEIPAAPLPTALNNGNIRRNGQFLSNPASDESLDLEDGYNSFRINIKSDAKLHSDAPVSDVPVSGAPELPLDPEPASAEPQKIESGQQDAETPTPEKPENHQVVVATNVSSAAPPKAAPAKPLIQKPVRNNVFEDQRSTSRRRRKHHQRAAVQSGQAPEASVSAPKTITEPKTPTTPLADEKEIKMWEDALKNPSPAIKRQAARMLKKLTGRDYDV